VAGVGVAGAVGAFEGAAGAGAAGVGAAGAEPTGVVAVVPTVMGVEVATTPVAADGGAAFEVGLAVATPAAVSAVVLTGVCGAEITVLSPVMPPAFWVWLLLAEAARAAANPGAAAAAGAAASTPTGPTVAATAETAPVTAARGLPCVTAARRPGPDTDRPRVPTLACWPAVTLVTWPVLSAVTSTVPRATATPPLARPTDTEKCVPLTTAANIGVSTEKCWTFRFSTSNDTKPARSTTVVDKP